LSVLGRVAFSVIIEGSEVLDLAAGLFHVAFVFVYDFVESAVVNRVYDVVVARYVDYGRLVQVIPSLFRPCRRRIWASVPVSVVPVDVSQKQSDLVLQAVRLLMHLEESGPKRQTELAEELGMEAWAMSRLLANLELHRYIVRRGDGADKLVSLLKT
jgi:hypothetical protein